jgi:hypothetical protein
MKQELVAYLFQSDGQVSEMPTDELLGSLEQLRQAGIAQEQSTSADNLAIYAFLQTLKQTMHTCRTGAERNFGVNFTL